MHLSHWRARFQRQRDSGEVQALAPSWERVTEPHWNTGVKAESGWETKEAPVGMWNPSLMVTDSGGGSSATCPVMPGDPRSQWFRPSWR